MEESLSAVKSEQIKQESTNNSAQLTLPLVLCLDENVSGLLESQYIATVGVLHTNAKLIRK